MDNNIYVVLTFFLCAFLLQILLYLSFKFPWVEKMKVSDFYIVVVPEESENLEFSLMNLTNILKVIQTSDDNKKIIILNQNLKEEDMKIIECFRKDYPGIIEVCKKTNLADNENVDIV